jgi:nickel-dependent lactate racemase
MGRSWVYYKGKPLDFKIPPDWNIVAVASPRDVQAVTDVKGEIRRAINNPVDSKTLDEFVLPTHKVVIISDDHLRPTPTASMISVLLEELNRIGVSRGNVTVVIARGTHGLPSDAALKVKVGDENLSRVKVVVHDSENRQELVDLGSSSRGTPILVNKTVVEADIKIGLGTIAPHYFAGFSGGPKIILPGVSGKESIVGNHGMSKEPNTVLGVLEGNPIWEDMLEVARRVGLNMKLDSILNMKNEVVNVVAGDVERAFKAGIETFNRIYRVTIPEKVDVTIASGYPLEAELAQACKAVIAADLITKDGGTIILVASCSDGVGSGLYEILREKATPETIYSWIPEHKISPSGGPMGARLRQLTRTKRLIIATDGLTQKIVEEMGIGYAADLNGAIRETAKLYSRPTVAVLPAGASTFPAALR